MAYIVLYTTIRNSVGIDVCSRHDGTLHTGTNVNAPSSL